MLALIVLLFVHFVSADKETVPFVGWKVCPNGEFVKGMMIKYQKGSTTTALDAVALYCAPLYSCKEDKHNWIMSGEATWGQWNIPIQWCPSGTTAVGYSIRRSNNHSCIAQPETLINFQIKCENPYARDIKKGVWLEGKTENCGVWDIKKYCVNKTALCGINTAVKPYKRKDIPTGVVDVNIKCCNLDFDNQ